jgi:hypothetical protein
MGSARTNTEGTPLTFTTEAYNRAALRELLQEANTIAQALSLPEWLPIKEENIVDVFIVPYGITRHRPMIGRIYTKNYAYFASVGYKMSYVEGTHQDRDWGCPVLMDTRLC